MTPVSISPLKATSFATGCTVVTVIPSFLTGASAVFMKEELDFDEAALGAAIMTFFALASLTSLLAARSVERLGAGVALKLASLGSSIVLVTIPMVTTTFIHVVVGLAIAGALNGIAHPAANLALARHVHANQGLLFGVKQSAIPFSTLVAGAFVPTVGLTIGWRWSYIMGGILAAIMALIVPRTLGSGTAQSLPHMSRDASIPPLVALSLGAGIGAAAASSLGIFLVEGAVASGLAPSTAGWLLVCSSAAGIGSRVLVGWIADHHHGKALYGVATMLLIGAIGYALLANGSLVGVLVGAVLAYTCGWGWTGLLFYAVVRLSPNSPAVATGTVQAGTSAGAALGPPVFGLVARSSFEVAWMGLACAAAASAVVVSLARAWLVNDRQQSDSGE